MPLFEVGLTHHRAASDLLAALSEGASGLTDAIFARCPEVAGVVVLATCNRVEVYVDSPVFHSAVDAVTGALVAAGGERGMAIQGALMVHTGQGVAEHLFSVASGLDSMVLGENEITGQVRRAISAAPRASAKLRRLFDAALTTAKAVATQTTLAAAGRSVASVGLDIAEERHGSLTDGRVLVVGTGNFARVVCADLPRRGCRDVLVYSASGRAETFCQTHAATPVPAEGLLDAVRAADVVVCCSTQGTVVLSSATLSEAMADRDDVLRVVDLSLGGNLEPGARDLAMVDVIDLDTVGQHDAAQSVAVEAAHTIVSQGVETWLHVEEGRQADPAITAMRSHVSAIIEDEIERTSRLHSPEVTDAVARSLRRVSNALLHAPSVRAAELARSGELDDYRRALHTLFGIEVPQ